MRDRLIHRNVWTDCAPTSSDAADQDFVGKKEDELLRQAVSRVSYSCSKPSSTTATRQRVGSVWATAAMAMAMVDSFERLNHHPPRDVLREA